MDILDIWEENADFVFKICLRYLKDTKAAEDVRQEVFLKIIASKRKFENLSSERTWIYSIAFHCCIDYFRREKKQRAIEDEVYYSGHLSLNDSQTPVWEVGKPSRMPCPISQLFVELYFGEGWDTIEIAQIFGFSAGYVNRKIQVGINQLRKIF